ncbi:MAG: divergent polysaccharide deacetylase family protein [Rhodovibrionaceae bacterium]
MTAGARIHPSAIAEGRPVVSADGEGPSVLAIAWILLLALLVVLAGYVLWQRHVAPQRQSAEILLPSSPAGAERTAPAVVAEPPPREPEGLPLGGAGAPGDFAALDFAIQETPSDGTVGPATESPVEPPAQAQLAAPPLQLELAEAEKPWQRNASVFSVPPEQPVIAVVISGLGLSASATEAAITLLPPEVTLSFTPYSKRLNDWIALARIFGHEVMLDLPMEAPGAAEAIGAYGLTSAAGAAENLARLEWILSRGRAMVGVAGAYGQSFLGNPAALRPVLARLRERGLIFLDNAPQGYAGSSGLAADLRLPFAASDDKVDQGLASRRAIDARLVKAEDLALRRGAALVMAEPLPVSIERISTWLLGLAERGVEVAPISELARRNLEVWQAAR